jgi:hypothetical protein
VIVNIDGETIWGPIKGNDLSTRSIRVGSLQ